MVQSTIINKKGRAGYCELRAPGCGGYTTFLEWHHESYEPTPKEAKKLGLGLDTDHACHFTVHFWPSRLTHANKVKLILRRIGEVGRIAAAKGDLDVEALARAYIPPNKE